MHFRPGSDQGTMWKHYTPPARPRPYRTRWHSWFRRGARRTARSDPIEEYSRQPPRNKTIISILIMGMAVLLLATMLSCIDTMTSSSPSNTLASLRPMGSAMHVTNSHLDDGTHGSGSDSGVKYPLPEWAYTLHVFVVNLKHRQERWQHMQGLLGRTKVFDAKYTFRQDAVLGKELELPELYQNNRLSEEAYRSMLSPRTIGGMYMTAGGLGCMLSHVKLWSKCIQLNRPLLVLEDDIELVEDFDTKFDMALRQLPPDFGLFYLADMVNSKSSQAAATPVAGSPMINKLDGEHWGTYAYLISPRAAAILYHRVFPLRYQVDSYIIDNCKLRNISVYRAAQNLVVTDNSKGRESDVQERPNPFLFRKNSPYEMLQIPARLLLLEGLPPYDEFYQELSMLGDSFRIDYYDSMRLYQEEGIDVDIDGFNNSVPNAPVSDAILKRIATDESLLTTRDPMYDLKLFRLQISLLYDHGGVFIHRDYTVHHNVEKIIPIGGGFFGFDTMGDRVHYPVIGLRAGHPMGEKLLEHIDTVLQTNSTIAEAFQALHKYIHPKASFFPKQDAIVMFPARVLKGHGY